MARPPTAPASQVVHNEGGAAAEWLRSRDVRLYVIKRSALSAPYPRIGAVEPRMSEAALLNCPV